MPVDTVTEPFASALSFVESVPLSAQQFVFATEEPAGAVQISKAEGFIALDGVLTPIRAAPDFVFNDEPPRRWLESHRVRHFRLEGQAHLIGDIERNLYIWESDTKRLTPLGRGELIRVPGRGYLNIERYSDHTTLFDFDVLHRRLRPVDVNTGQAPDWDLERFGVIKDRLVVTRTEKVGENQRRIWISVPATDRPSIRGTIPEIVLKDLPGKWRACDNFAAGTRLLFCAQPAFPPADAGMNTEHLVGDVLIVDWTTGHRHREKAVACVGSNFACFTGGESYTPPKNCRRDKFRPLRAGWCKPGENPFDTFGAWELRGDRVFNCVMEDSGQVVVKRDVPHTPPLDEPGTH